MVRAQMIFQSMQLVSFPLLVLGSPSLSSLLLDAPHAWLIAAAPIVDAAKMMKDKQGAAKSAAENLLPNQVTNF